MTSHQIAVCDTCKARKVRCDRDDPCGNCVDGNISCQRTLSSHPKPRSTSKRSGTVGKASSRPKKTARQHDLEATPSPSSYSPSVSQSPSIIEAHDFIRRQIGSAQYMSTERVEVLNAAMSFVKQGLQGTKPEVPNNRTTRVTDVLDSITYPSIELLYWMLRELRGSNIGPHVLDYFKHVSPKSLKHMGLSLINRSGSPETLLLYSICVNSAAFKFINTVLSGSDIQDVEEGMRERAATYLNSIKIAMGRIQLLSAPSLVFLQSLLCSAFIAQGTGDSTACWAFISTACKVCEDLNLHSQVQAHQATTDDDEEIYYCYVWCHLLDKNHSMMLGRSRCLLDYEGVELAFSHPLNRSMSALLTTYVHFLPIQALFVSELHPAKIANDSSLVEGVESTVQDLLDRLTRIHTRITALHGPSDSWSGLHSASELNAIEFSYHSMRTSILRSRQLGMPSRPYIHLECLESARNAMSTLRAIQDSSMTITDIRSHIAYMHWTALYHPLTPFFVLFCNVVATSNKWDFATLKLVTEQLDGLVAYSPSIARLQALFKAFLGLCKGLIKNGGNGCAASYEETADPSYPGNVTSHPLMPAIITDPVFEAHPLPVEMPPDNSLPHVVPNFMDSTLFDDPGWGLFDVQPTLDWLDADFSFLDNNQ